MREIYAEKSEVGIQLIVAHILREETSWELWKVTYPLNKTNQTKALQKLKVRNTKMEEVENLVDKSKLLKKRSISVLYFILRREMGELVLKIKMLQDFWNEQHIVQILSFETTLHHLQEQIETQEAEIGIKHPLWGERVLAAISEERERERIARSPLRRAAQLIPGFRRESYARVNI